MKKHKSNMIAELSTPLELNEVEFRIQSISDKGWATILVYKDARVDMNRLDQVCGAKWQRKHTTIDGRLYCSIGIYDEELNKWVWRQDVGTESQTEKEKGQASDSFKRAGFNWGIGRELYDYPRIFLQLKETEFRIAERNGKKYGQATYKLALSNWMWQKTTDINGDIILVGADESGSLRYYSTRNVFENTPSNALPPLISEKRIKMLKDRVAQGHSAEKIIALTERRFLLTQEVKDEILNHKKQ